MKVGRVQIGMRKKSSLLHLKEAILASFWEPSPSIRARLSCVSAAEWKRVKYWLDVSGLALYFLDRVETLGLHTSVPAFMLDHLRKDHADNRERNRSLLVEAGELCRILTERGVEFAFLKGATLPPESVRDQALRSQADLDLLVRESQAEAMKEALAGLGYKLDAVSGATWEFKAGPGTSTLKNLYQVRAERSVEVHLIADSGVPDRLGRSHRLSIQGCLMPALAAADIFVQQAQHLFKHTCGEYTRASWVLEYWRHLCARRNDIAFWREVRQIADRQPGSDIAIGTATLLTSFVFGPCAPPELACWSMNRLSPAVCLWIQLYGRRVLLSDTPGSKLYLLLRKELESDSVAETRKRRRLMFPIHVPRRITQHEAGEKLSVRLHRYWKEAGFFVRRTVFHVVEGIRFAIESTRWQRRVSGVAR